MNKGLSSRLQSEIFSIHIDQTTQLNYDFNLEPFKLD